MSAPSRVALQFVLSPEPVAKDQALASPCSGMTEPMEGVRSASIAPDTMALLRYLLSSFGTAGEFTREEVRSRMLI